MDTTELEKTIEALLLASEQPLNVERIESLFAEEDRPGREEIRTAVKALENTLANRALELKQVASGWRIQVRQDYAEYIGRMWQERPPRYSRALLETLALITYRQPITRGEIEEVRGVSLSTSIIKTLLEREWIREVGHREVPGRPALFGTTRQFLDDFNLKSLDQLPSLPEIRDLEALDEAAMRLEEELGLSEQTQDEEQATDAIPPEQPGSDADATLH